MRHVMPPALVLVLLACGPAATPSTAATPVPSVSGAPSSAAAPLRRAEVVRAVDEGLGALLAHAEVAPVQRNGTFVGFAVVRSDREGALSRVGLQPGDVLLAVGGKSIRTPDEAQVAFEELRTAPAIVLEVERDGARKTLTTPIAP